MNRDEILHYIKKQDLAVISSINENGQVNSAVVGFAVTDELEIIFGTYIDSRKYINITKNSRVSFVIGWSEGNTVQYEGIAKELSKEEADKYIKIFIKKNPASEKYITETKQRWFKVKPVWLRYTNLKKKPWDIVEFSF